jgi:hypothetical protein
VEDLIASLADGSDQLGAVASAGSAAAAVADARRRSSAEGVEFGAKLAAVQTLVDAAAASLEADSEGYALVGQALAWLRTDPSASAAGAVAVAQQQSRLECRCASIAIDAAAAAARSFAAVVDAATDSFDPRAHWQLARARVSVVRSVFRDRSVCLCERSSHIIRNRQKHSTSCGQPYSPRWAPSPRQSPSR